MTQLAFGPWSRTGAPSTSAEAAASVAPDLPERQLEVLAAIRTRPASADEVARRIGRSILSVRPRVSELHDAGLIAQTGIRTKNESGRNACVWHCTGLGIAALDHFTGGRP